MDTFIDDDAGYVAWLATHPEGLVVNTTRRPSRDYLMLHEATCRSISGAPARGARWTDEYIKICGTDAELRAWAQTRVDGELTPCGLCLR